jgi:hypothetical protein
VPHIANAIAKAFSGAAFVALPFLAIFLIRDRAGNALFGVIYDKNQKIQRKRNVVNKA